MKNNKLNDSSSTLATIQIIISSITLVAVLIGTTYDAKYKESATTLNNMTIVDNSPSFKASYITISSGIEDVLTNEELKKEIGYDQLLYPAVMVDEIMTTYQEFSKVDTVPSEPFSLSMEGLTCLIVEQIGKGAAKDVKIECEVMYGDNAVEFAESQGIKTILLGDLTESEGRVIPIYVTASRLGNNHIAYKIRYVPKRILYKDSQSKELKTFEIREENSYPIYINQWMVGLG